MADPTPADEDELDRLFNDAWYFDVPGAMKDFRAALAEHGYVVVKVPEPPIYGAASKTDRFLRSLGRYLRKQEGWWDDPEWADTWAPLALDMAEGRTAAVIEALALAQEAQR